MIARLIAVPVAVAAVAACAGQQESSAPAAKTTTVEVSYDDLLNQKRISRDVALRVGDTLKIVLASNASTGYAWTAQALIGDPAILVQDSHDVAGPDNSRPGAPGTETWTFTALKTGSSTLTTDYGQPWPGGQQDAWTFTAAVTVR